MANGAFVLRIDLDCNKVACLVDLALSFRGYVDE